MLTTRYTIHIHAQVRKIKGKRGRVILLCKKQFRTYTGRGRISFTILVFSYKILFTHPLIVCIFVYLQLIFVSLLLLQLAQAFVTAMNAVKIKIVYQTICYDRNGSSDGSTKCRTQGHRAGPECSKTIKRTIPSTVTTTHVHIDCALQ